MMDETATSSGTHADDPVINVIESDPPLVVEPARGTARADRFDRVAGDALAARRRREFDAARARLRDQAIRADHERSQAGGQRPSTADASRRGGGDESATRCAPLGNPPEKVRKRYLHAGNQYFLKDAPHQLAFEDIGPYLVTEHNRPDVVESMVDMVRAKAWGRIRVSGHELFRREVWVQATLLGIKVSGYEPKAVDLARVAEARRERMTNRIDVSENTAAAPTPAGQQNPLDVEATTSGSRAAQPVNADPPRQSVAGGNAPPAPKDVALDTASPDTGSGGTEAQGQERQRYVGELVEHGGAPYQHNPGNRSIAHTLT